MKEQIHGIINQILKKNKLCDLETNKDFTEVIKNRELTEEIKQIIEYENIVLKLDLSQKINKEEVMKEKKEYIELEGDSILNRVQVIIFNEKLIYRKNKIDYSP